MKSCISFVMHVIWGGGSAGRAEFAHGQKHLSSVITSHINNITSHHSAGHGVRVARWIHEAELQQPYSTIWLMLPVGSIFITALVILLMVMFNRCPQMVAAVVTGILGTIVVFIVLMSLERKPIYL